MPFYRVNGLMVHMRLSGKAPAPCVARLGLAGGQQVQCMGISGYLCDWPVDGGKTCDAPVCDHHANQVGRNRHYCPLHFAQFNATQPQLGLFTSITGNS